jgi:hypothetical protein
VAIGLHSHKTSGFEFPGVVSAFRLGPEWGEMGFCWKGLACGPLSIFGVTTAVFSLARLSFTAFPVVIDLQNCYRYSGNSQPTLPVPHQTGVSALTVLQDL